MWMNWYYFAVDQKKISQVSFEEILEEERKVYREILSWMIHGVKRLLWIKQKKSK